MSGVLCGSEVMLKNKRKSRGSDVNEQTVILKDVLLNYNGLTHVSLLLLMLQSILDAQKTSVPGCQIAVNGATEKVCRRAADMHRHCQGGALGEHSPQPLPRVQHWQSTITEQNREMGTERHLWQLDAFSWLLMHPKCICGAQNPAGGTCSAPPDFSQRGVACCSSSRASPLLLAFSLEFRPFGPQECTT